MVIIAQPSTIDSIEGSGFACKDCAHGDFNMFQCFNCSFCTTGHYSNREGSCVPCPAGIEERT